MRDMAAEAAQEDEQSEKREPISVHWLARPRRGQNRGEVGSQPCAA